MTSEERVKLFVVECEALQKKYEVEIQPVIDYGPQGSATRIVVTDKKPALKMPGEAPVAKPN